jgi:tetratricopeptide (TPR) repeat protein
MMRGTEQTPDEELAQARDVLEWALRTKGPDDPLSIKAMIDVADQLARQQRGAEESVLRREAVAALRASMGPEHESTVNAEFRLGICLTDQGQAQEARALLAHVVATRTLALGPDAPETLIAVAWSATAAKRLGELHEARHLQEQVVRGWEAAGTPPDDGRATLAAMNLASTLVDLGDLHEATGVLRGVLDARGGIRGSGDARSMDVLEALTNITLAAGDVSQATELARSLLEERAHADSSDGDGAVTRARALLALAEERAGGR